MIRVRDTGQGIAADDLERIFEPFTRVGGGNTSGTGLGLTITRQLVKRMGRQLEVESKPGVGSEFRVGVACPRIQDEHHKMTPLSGTVLWVDDDQDILSLYQLVLENWGLRVLTVSSVSQAKEMIKHHDFLVVITDMHLTDGDGLELFRYLRAKRPGILGIIISGSGLVDIPTDISASGILKFLQKPIEAEVLYTELAAALNGGSPEHTV